MVSIPYTNGSTTGWLPRKKEKGGKKSTVKRKLKQKITEETDYIVEKIVSHRVGKNGKLQLLTK